MTHPSILVMGYTEAAMLLRKPGDVRIAAVIAIHGQREYPVSMDGVYKSLILQFDDTETPINDDLLQASRIRQRQREAEQMGLILSPPTLDHSRQIIDFARSLAGMDGTLLCHCLGGISRSAAAAILCLATWLGSGNEDECIRYVLKIRPSAMPHRDVIGFGDELLGRNGKLIESLDRFVLG